MSDKTCECSINGNPTGSIRAIAEIIDPGCWSTWHDGASPDAREVEPDVRILYARSVARLKAIGIIKLLLATNHESLIEEVIADEVAGWLARMPNVDEKVILQAVSKKWNKHTPKDSTPEPTSEGEA